MRFSIITLTYNREYFIAKNMQSVKNQTYQDFEQIIIDDCSTDRTAQIVKENLHSKVKFVEHEQDMGLDHLIDSYNEGIQMATGDYVLLLDGDDFLLEDALESFNKVLSSDVSLCFGKCYAVRDGIIYATVPALSGRDCIDQKNFLKRAAYSDIFYTSSSVFSLEALKKVGGLQGWKGVFHVTFLQMFMYGKVVFLDKVLSMRTHHKSNASFQFSLADSYRSSEYYFNLTGLTRLLNMRRVRLHWKFNLLRDWARRFRARAT